MLSDIVQFQTIFIVPHRREWNFLGVGGWGSVRPKNVAKCMSFQRGGVGGLRKNPFSGEGMDILWNYTICCGTGHGHYSHKLKNKYSKFKNKY